MTTLVVDAYDSFVYVIAQYLGVLGAQPVVKRNDKLTLADIERLNPSAIVLGPGPGHPSQAHYVEVIRAFGATTPILGVCLGHQAIGLAFGGRVEKAAHLMHGKTSHIEHDGKGCFTGCPPRMLATRYHSLIVEEAGLPDELVVSARSTDDGYVMGLRHRHLPIESVQFHPESICTHRGIELLRNFLQPKAS